MRQSNTRQGVLCTLQLMCVVGILLCVVQRMMPVSWLEIYSMRKEEGQGRSPVARPYDREYVEKRPAMHEHSDVVHLRYDSIPAKAEPDMPKLLFNLSSRML